MRFNESMAQPPKPSKEKAPKPEPKFGGKGGRTDYSQLANAKKIISNTGGIR